MQDKRGEFALTLEEANAMINNGDSTAAIEKTIAYESYVREMQNQRLAARTAYEDLTEEQKNGVDPELVAKLYDELETTYDFTTEFTIVKSTNEYSYQIIAEKNKPNSYELSQCFTGEMPFIAILADSSGDATKWHLDKPYDPEGGNSYDLAYCCDVEWSPKDSQHYKRMNLEDSDYYGKTAAKKIRAIVQSSYPFVSLEEMKANLKNDLDEDFVDSLTRGDIIASVQAAIWAYANNGLEEGKGNIIDFRGTYDMKNSTSVRPMHDFRNELWDYWSVKPKSYRRGTLPTLVYENASAPKRVNTLTHYLCGLPGVEAPEDQFVISDAKITRARLLTTSKENEYEIGMYVLLNGGAETDDLTIKVTCTQKDGTITSRGSFVAKGMKTQVNYRAKYGDTVRVEVEGTQELPRGVYFYWPEGDSRDSSQALVGVAQGKTRVRAEESFLFDEDITKGIRIHKSAKTGDKNTDLPLEGLYFDIYQIPEGESASTGSEPTAEEIEKFAVEGNLAGTVTTDNTGYAKLQLDNNGKYLVVERADETKIKAPADPFYFMIPSPEIDEEGHPLVDDDGITIMNDIVSVYPKNEPVPPPDTPPVIPPPPKDVTGGFSIIKLDSVTEEALEGAEFELYRLATEADDEGTRRTVTIDEASYSVVSMGTTLTTDADGKASVTDLLCGTYFLEETKAPEGYELLEEFVKVEAVSDALKADPVPFEIYNNEGSFLPSTGGMGTGIFRVLGCMLLLLAGLAVLEKRFSLRAIRQD